MGEASVVMKLKDQYSATARSMASANQNFNKSLEETRQQMQAYEARIKAGARQQAELEVSIRAAKKELREAEKQFGATGEAADQEKVVDAQEKFNLLKLELQGVTKSSREAQKALEELESSSSRKKSGSGSGTSSAEAGLAERLGASGLSRALGEWTANIGSYAVESALGSAASGYVSSTLSGAATGAAIGSVIAPGIGTAIGAALGGVAGLVSGYIDELRKKDDYYRDAVDSIYEDVTGAQEEALSNGGSVAASRETTKMSFQTLLGGEAAADALLDELHEFANVTPYTYDTLTGSAKAALAYGYDAADVMTLLANAGNASAALGAGTEGLSTIVDVIGRANMGTLETDQLKRLINIGINPFQLLANASNDMAANGEAMIASGLYSEEECENIRAMMEHVAEEGEYTAAVIQEMVSEGLIPAQMAAAALSDQLGQVYDGALEVQSQTYEGLESTLQGLNDDLDAAMGEAYNDVRKAGMQEQIDYLNGEGGEQMRQAYALIGEYQAELVNKQDELERTAIESVMTGTLTGDWGEASEYYQARLEALMEDYDTAEAEGDGAQMGRIIAEAQALAQAEYTNTDGYQMQVDANLELLEGVQAAVAGAYYDAGYAFAQQQSKGYAAGLSLLTGGVGVEIPDDADFSTFNATGYAYGLDYVPYDGFPAILHEGERVLTAQQARQGAASVSVEKLADTIVVREDADIDRIAAAIVERVSGADLIYGG